MAGQSCTFASGAAAPSQQKLLILQRKSLSWYSQLGDTSREVPFHGNLLRGLPVKISSRTGIIQAIYSDGNVKVEFEGGDVSVCPAEDLERGKAPTHLFEALVLVSAV